MPPDLLTTLTQFGAAGLIAWMWLVERRSAGERERQLAEAHRALMEQRVQLERVLSVVSDNTRAVTALEAGQRRLAEVIERAAPHRRVGPGPAARADAAPAA